MSGISVIIPNYNRADVIDQTIQNILDQTLPPDEIIVVDDGSTDSSIEVIESFGNKVKLIQQKNQGPGAARNAGFEIAKGDYIQFMDSDDIMSLNKLEIQFRALINSNSDFAYCPWIRSRINKKHIQFIGKVIQGAKIPDWKPMLEWQLGSWCLIFQNCLFDRSILHEAGRYRTDLMPTEDSEYLVRILLKGANPIYTPECLVFYRVDGEGQNQITSSGTNSKQRAEDRTNYMNIVSSLVADKLDHFHKSTKREIALDVYRHNRFCKNMGYISISNKNVFYRLMKSYPKWKILYFDYVDRINRKCSNIPDQNPLSNGLMYRPISEDDIMLAENSGLFEK